ncbi:MAG: GDP-mannose 4,6-dehydratase, partial [Oscillospiraceae bacterium]|nr:GDP-mannose 4,6-dehydratase [Oscillospiraceae bacterium]
MSTVLLVGGAGFIGSHTAVELIGGGYDVVVADNLSNSDAAVMDRIAEITGVRPAFYRADAADKSAMEEIFRTHRFDAVIHFGGKKSVD